MSFEEMESVMRRVFESDTCRFEVLVTLRGFRLEKTLSDIEVLNDLDDLNWLMKRINRLIPQCPEGVRSEKDEM